MSDIDQQNNTEVVQEGYGSLERAALGHFHFSISDIMSESWERIKGNKGTIWLALILIIVISAIVNVVCKYVLNLVGIVLPDSPSFTAAYIVPTFVLAPILAAMVTTPLTAGIWMLSIKLATDQVVEPTEVTKYYSKWLNLFLTYLAMFALILIGYCLLILPGIYLAVAFYFALPLAAEKNMSVWQALETSRRAVNHIWFPLFGLMFIFGLLCMASIFTLFIGMIWLLPMMIMSYGVMYRIIFGVEKSVVVSA